MAGRTCVYAKRIQVVFTFNVSLSDFQADVASVRTKFLQSLHDAAGIQVGQHAVEITLDNAVQAGPPGRRLLQDTAEYIHVYATYLNKPSVLVSVSNPVK